MLPWRMGYKFGGDHRNDCVCPVCNKQTGEHYNHCVCPLCKKLGGGHNSDCGVPNVSKRRVASTTVIVRAGYV